MVQQTLLLTGASGMVGRNILEHPLASKWNILSPSSRELDLTNALTVSEYFHKHKPDLVIHAAGKVGGIQANMANPLSFLEVNTTIGRNVIMSAHQAGVRNFLNLASTCMYPREAPNPLRESAILTGELEPTNEGYALAKIFTTKLCQYIAREDKNAQYKTIIPCNLYGRHDKFNPEISHLIPAIINKIHSAKKMGVNSVEIWGDGTARREFMYAGDLADAVLKAADEIETIPEIMNCGLGYDYTINDYYEIAAAEIGWQGEFIRDLSKPVGMKQKLSSIDLQSQWGWSPQTSLAEGIRNTFNFYINEATK